MSLMLGEIISSPVEKFSALRKASTPKANATRTTATSTYNGQRRPASLEAVLGSVVILPPAPRCFLPRPLRAHGTVPGGSASRAKVLRRCVERGPSLGPKSPPSVRRESRKASLPQPKGVSTRRTGAREPHVVRQREPKQLRVQARAATHPGKRLPPRYRR